MVAQRQVTDYFSRDYFGAKEVGFASVRSKRLQRALLHDDNVTAKMRKTKGGKKSGNEVLEVVSNENDDVAYENFYKRHWKEIRVGCDRCD